MPQLGFILKNNNSARSPSKLYNKGRIDAVSDRIQNSVYRYDWKDSEETFLWTTANGGEKKDNL